MGKPYSVDLRMRMRVVGAVDAGEPVEEVAERYAMTARTWYCIASLPSPTQRKFSITRSGNRPASLLRPNGPAVLPARGHAPGEIVALKIGRAEGPAIRRRKPNGRPFGPESRAGPMGPGPSALAGRMASPLGLKNGCAEGDKSPLVIGNFCGGRLVVHPHSSVGFGDHLLASAHVLANVATAQVQVGGPVATA